MRYPAVVVHEIGLLLRVHRRHEWLGSIFAQMKELARGRRAHLVVMADRPSPAVVGALADVEKKLHSLQNFRYTLTESPGAIRSAAGCSWTSTADFIYRKLFEGGPPPQAAMLIDDDCLFSELAILELRGHLALLEFDRVEATWLNALDPGAKHYDAGFPRHDATCLFRVYPDVREWGDTLTKTLGGGGTHSPLVVARSPNFGRLQGKVIHFGYCSPDRREQAWNSAKACGQLDGYFNILNLEPRPSRCRGNAERPWKKPSRSRNAAR